MLGAQSELNAATTRRSRHRVAPDPPIADRLIPTARSWMLDAGIGIHASKWKTNTSLLPGDIVCGDTITKQVLATYLRESDRASMP